MVIIARNSCRRSIGVVAAAALGAFASSGAIADVIYDNTTTSTGSRSFTALQIGDEINAAGTARFITELHIGVTQQGFEGRADLQAFLYANDGPGGEPGTLLWESDTMDNVPLTGGDDLIPFDVPSVEVPDTFTWTILISDTEPVAVGLPHYHPPTVGMSPENAWFGGPGSWTILRGDNPINFMSRIVADDGGGGLAITVDAECPGGGAGTLDWSGATPGGRVAVVAALEPGSITVPGGPCAGTELGIGSRGARLVAIVSSDAAGAGSLSGNVPPAGCGAFVQLLDLSSCETSNVAVIE